MKTITIVAALRAIGGGGWFGYRHYFAEETAAGFITEPLAREDIVRTVAATGTIEPLIKVIVGSQVSGNILKWHADFNAEVKAGDVLARIDPARFKTAQAQAKANLALAKANEEESHVRFKDAERDRILATLNAHGWNRAKAARALGMARRTFYRRLKEHDIELPQGKGQPDQKG